MSKLSYRVSISFQSIEENNMNLNVPIANPQQVDRSIITIGIQVFQSIRFIQPRTTGANFGFQFGPAYRGRTHSKVCSRVCSNRDSIETEKKNKSSEMKQ